MSRRGTAAVMMPYDFPRVSGDEPWFQFSVVSFP